MAMKRPTPKKASHTTGDRLFDAALAAVDEADADVGEGLRARLVDDPADPGALFDLGNTLDEFGRRDDAVEIWRRLVSVDPEHDMGWFSLAVVAKEREQWGEAMVLFDRAHALDPDDPSTLHCRGHVHQELGEHQRGREDLERAIELYSEMIAGDPDDAEAPFWRGAARARLGDRDAALADLAVAIGLDPDRREEAREEVDFQPFVDDPEFIHLTTKPTRRRR